ncbi:uncharacterized protein LOC113212680 [Frankliniella occidentalis]|uniref:Uncharacterized protein LOC113212680 n=1 Tax=Frankliniella occidentalis TaxID=133901 RepID=A0A9C6XW89_FRAOC|nr:uncharacterized protein LOC113212680 [Frankliniella occidentalis]
MVATTTSETPGESSTAAFPSKAPAPKPSTPVPPAASSAPSSVPNADAPSPSPVPPQELTSPPPGPPGDSVPLSSAPREDHLVSHPDTEASPSTLPPTAGTGETTTPSPKTKTSQNKPSKSNQKRRGRARPAGEASTSTTTERPTKQLFPSWGKYYDLFGELARLYGAEKYLNQDRAAEGTEEVADKHGTTRKRTKERSRNTRKRVRKPELEDVAEEPRRVSALEVGDHINPVSQATSKTSKDKRKAGKKSRGSPSKGEGEPSTVRGKLHDGDMSLDALEQLTSETPTSTLKRQRKTLSNRKRPVGRGSTSETNDGDTDASLETDEETYTRVTQKSRNTQRKSSRGNGSTAKGSSSGKSGGAQRPHDGDMSLDSEATHDQDVVARSSEEMSSTPEHLRLPADLEPYELAELVNRDFDDLVAEDKQEMAELASDDEAESRELDAEDAEEDRFMAEQDADDPEAGENPEGASSQEVYISPHENPPEPATRPNYTHEGMWAHPPPEIGIDFIPQQSFTQVRRYETVSHLSPEDALAEATNEEEYANAPRLREAISHRKTVEVYSEEGYEDAGYDHGGYNKAGEHHEVVPGYEATAMMVKMPDEHDDHGDHEGEGDTREEYVLEPEGAGSQTRGSKVRATSTAAPRNRTRHGANKVTKGSWGITQVVKDDDDKVKVLSEGGNITSPTTLRPNRLQGGRYAAKHTDSASSTTPSANRTATVAAPTAASPASNVVRPPPASTVASTNVAREPTTPAPDRSKQRRPPTRPKRPKKPRKKNKNVSKIPSQLLGFKYPAERKKPKGTGKKNNSPLAKAKRKRKMKERERKRQRISKLRAERARKRAKLQSNKDSSKSDKLTARPVKEADELQGKQSRFEKQPSEGSKLSSPLANDIPHSRNDKKHDPALFPHKLIETLRNKPEFDIFSDKQNTPKLDERPWGYLSNIDNLLSPPKTPTSPWAGKPAWASLTDLATPTQRPDMGLTFPHRHPERYGGPPFGRQTPTPSSSKAALHGTVVAPRQPGKVTSAVVETSERKNLNKNVMDVVHSTRPSPAPPAPEYDWPSHQSDALSYFSPYVGWRGAQQPFFPLDQRPAGSANVEADNLYDTAFAPMQQRIDELHDSIGPRLRRAAPDRSPLFGDKLSAKAKRSSAFPKTEATQQLEARALAVLGALLPSTIKYVAPVVQVTDKKAPDALHRPDKIRLMMNIGKWRAQARSTNGSIATPDAGHHSTAINGSAAQSTNSTQAPVIRQPLVDSNITLHVNRTHGAVTEQGALNASPAATQGAHKAAPAAEQGAHKAAPAAEQGAHRAAPAAEQGAQDAASAASSPDGEVLTTPLPTASEPEMADTAERTVDKTTHRYEDNDDVTDDSHDAATTDEDDDTEETTEVPEHDENDPEWVHDDDEDDNHDGGGTGAGADKGDAAPAPARPKPSYTVPYQARPVVDQRKYPFYRAPESDRLTSYTPLRYATNPYDVPVKSEGGMEFYESRDRLVHCDGPRQPSNVVPERAEDGAWNERPQPDGPRLGSLGDVIGCMRKKLFGENPLDNPFFQETSVGLPQETALVGLVVDAAGTPAPEMFDKYGFYRDIMASIQGAESAGPLRPDSAEVVNRPYIRTGAEAFDSAEAPSSPGNVRVAYAVDKDGLGTVHKHKPPVVLKDRPGPVRKAKPGVVLEDALGVIHSSRKFAPGPSKHLAAHSKKLSEAPAVQQSRGPLQTVRLTPPDKTTKQPTLKTDSDDGPARIQLLQHQLQDSGEEGERGDSDEGRNKDMEDGDTTSEDSQSVEYYVAMDGEAVPSPAGKNTKDGKRPKGFRESKLAKSGESKQGKKNVMYHNIVRASTASEQVADSEEQASTDMEQKYNEALHNSKKVTDARNEKLKKEIQTMAKKKPLPPISKSVLKSLESAEVPLEQFLRSPKQQSKHDTKAGPAVSREASDKTPSKGQPAKKNTNKDAKPSRPDFDEDLYDIDVSESSDFIRPKGANSSKASGPVFFADHKKKGDNEGFHEVKTFSYSIPMEDGDFDGEYKLVRL